jgi:beta-lactamase class D OXA-2
VSSVRVSTCEKLIKETPILRELIRFGWKETSAFQRRSRSRFFAISTETSCPFRVEHQRLLKDIMIVEAGRDWILRAKTGWSGRVGWCVGWVEGPTGPVFFALNIDTPKRLDDLPKQEAVVRAILSSIKALPSG